MSSLRLSICNIEFSIRSNNLSAQADLLPVPRTIPRKPSRKAIKVPADNPFGRLGHSFSSSALNV
jgi:hypothetical protein